MRTPKFTLVRLRDTAKAHDAALFRVAHDRRVGPLRRTVAWFAWAYRRSPPRVLLKWDDGSLAPDLLASELLRCLGFFAAGSRAAEHKSAAAGDTALESSGWSGAAVFVLVWCAAALALISGATALGLIG